MNKPIDLAAVTAELADVFRPACERAGLRLVVDCPSLDGVVSVDQGLWQRLVLSLLSGVFRLTRTGEIGIRLRQIGNTAELCVFSSDNSITVDDVSIPLQALVKPHGGSVSVQSTAAAGTIFTLHLPLAEDVPLADEDKPHPAAADRPQRGSGKTWYDDGQHLKAFIDNAPSMMGVVELAADDSDILHVLDNAASEHFFGVPPGATPGRWSQRDLGVPGETIRKFARVYRQAQHSRQPVRLPHPFEPKSGESESGTVASPPQRHWLDVSVSYMGPGDDGRDRFCYTASNDTERVRAEQALRLSEERFRKIFEHAATGIAITDWRGDFQQCNPAYMSLLGYSAAELRHTNFTRLIHPQDLEANQMQIRRMKAGELSSFEIENRYVHKNGEPVWVRKFISILRDETGKPDHTIALVTDVTERRRTEQALRESEQRFRNMADTAPAMLWVTRADGFCTFLSRGWYDYTGQAESQALGFGWLDLVHEQDREQIGSVFLKANEQHEPFVLDYRVRRADGEYRWVSDAGRPRFETDGTFVGYIGSVIDVHERREAEQTLRESEERFRTLADNVSLFTWMAHPDGWIFWYNKRWYDYTGTTLEQMQGWGWKKVHHPDHIERVITRLQHSWDTGEPWEDTFPLRSKEGEYRWFLSRARPIRDDDGNVVRWFGTNTDVTEQRAAEEALRESDRRKDEFLATLAHELRNPLAPLRNSLELMKLAGHNTELVGQSRAMMERQLGQMVRLIDDLLDVSRISRGKLILRRERIALSRIIRDAMEITRPLIEQAGHEVVLRMPAEPVYLDADATRLAQVFSNLLNNAAKFTEHRGQIWLTVGHHGAAAVVNVRDNGVGIPPVMLHQIFELFTQVDRSLEKSRGGLGIGLSLAKRLVEMHDGTIEARSEGQNRGSEFIVYLPVAPSPDPDDQADDTAKTISHAGRHRILVVDDNIDAATSLATLLNIMGNDTRTAFDGLDALDVAARFLPDLVLLDIGMPKLNGYETARRIRMQEWGRDIILAALTGWGQEEDKRRSREAGFDFHLVKPVEPAALEKLLAGL